MINNKGMLIVISGPSGVGKGTICNEIIKRLNNIELSISATTRKPRNGEIEGINYYFKNLLQFKKMIERKEFIEYAKVYDNYYGTPKEPVINRLEKGFSVILEIDTNGAKQVKSNFKEAIFIFIMPPSFAELKKRLINRATESQKDIKKRMGSVFEEIQEIKNYDYIIINDDINKAAEEIICILNAEMHRTKRYNIDFLKFKEEFYD